METRPPPGSIFYVCQVGWSPAACKDDPLYAQNSCLCRSVNNRGKLIYCYSDLVPGEARDSPGDLTELVTTNLLTAQTVIWSLGLSAL